jgi:hypothetical protein
MTTPAPEITPAPAHRNSRVERRGLLAAAWAAVVGLILKHTTIPLKAAANLQFADTTTTVTNNAVGPTVMVAADTFPSASAVFTGQSVTSASRAGIQGVAGLRGNPLIICGVFGESGRGAGTAGVVGYGNGSSIGVMGQSDFGMPILGQVSSGSSSNTIAIYGLNNSTFTGPGPGAGGFGVYGLSAKGHGLVGATASAGAAAVVGATNGVAGAFAGAFYGPVIVGGDFTVFGAKSAAVPHPDGSHRRLYCLESPESWFEDFGKGQLQCGRAEIAIDPDFAGLVDLTDYFVFLSPRGGDAVLAVVDQTPTGFAVAANRTLAALAGKQDADLNDALYWRIVARRRDIAGPRLETVTKPQEPTLPPVPDLGTEEAATSTRVRR